VAEREERNERGIEGPEQIKWREKILRQVITASL
jgi:hypothetical protein